MKFSMLTIAGALATANAASIRGDAAKKIALMQKVTDAINKKAFRRLEENAQNYQGYAEDTVIQPMTCVTAKVYNAEGANGQNEGQNYGSTGPYKSYITFSGDTAVTNDGYSYANTATEEYATSLSSYLATIGASAALEQSLLAYDCYVFNNFCQMSDDEKAQWANMSEEEYEEYMQEQKEHQQQEKQNQQQHQQEQQNEQYSAYAAYSGGNRRHLYQAMDNLCYQCAVNGYNGDDEAADKPEEFQKIEEMFEEQMCQEVEGNLFMGHTCGSDGKSVELAIFTDEDCKYMSQNQNAYSQYLSAVGNGMYYDADGDGENDLNFGANYMDQVSYLFEESFSCQQGIMRNYNGAEGGQDSEGACDTLIENSVAKSQCNANGYNRKLQEGENQYYGMSGYDMIDSDNVADVCTEIFALEQAANSFMNPFAGQSFSQFQDSLSGGAIAGIVIALLAVVAVAAVVIKKKTEKKTDLEEPVFQGGALQ